jgi:hypothetical protein
MTESKENQNLESEKDNVIQMTNQQLENKLTPVEIADKAIEEICNKYSIKPVHIGMALSEGLQKQTDILRNQAKMYQAEATKAQERVGYKELIAREIKADKEIDNHNREMGEYVNDFIKTVTELFELNLPEEQQLFVEPILKKLTLPVAKLKQENQELIGLAIEKRVNEFCSNLAKMSKSELKEILKKYKQ